MVQKARKNNTSRNGSGKLRFALKDNGLLVPSKLDDTSVYAPLDFTSVTSREVGRQHSVWAVRHAYLIYMIGVVRSEVANLKYDLKNGEARWMLNHQGEYKNKWEAEHAAGARSKEIKRLRKLLLHSETQLMRYEALASSYQSLMQAASREMSRRADERNTRD